MKDFSSANLSPGAAAAGSRRTRSVSEGVVSETVFRGPHPYFEGIVTGEYQGWRESSKAIIRRREVPACIFPFIINFGAPFAIVDPARPEMPPRMLNTFVAGIHDSFVIVESSGESCCVQVNFTPIGARRFFQLPLSELSNISVGLDELYGDQSARIAEALAEAADWDQRFDLLEGLIARRIGAAKPPRPEIQRAWWLLQETNGRLPIADLAADVGWSSKHLIDQCRDQFGAPPKLLARLFRFQDAIKRVNESDQPRWAELAFDSGFFDQSHMIREFRRLAGCTPEAYARLQLPYGGVAADADIGLGISSAR
jgi:AraC-like DNA-binding protein